MKKRLLGALALLLGLSTLTTAGPVALAGPVTFTAAGPQTVTISAESRGGFVMTLAAVTGTCGVQVQGTQDGSVWTTLLLSKQGGTIASLTATATGTYTGNAGGFRSLRANVLYLAAGQGIARCILSWGDWLAPTNPTTAVTATP